MTTETLQSTPGLSGEADLDVHLGRSSLRVEALPGEAEVAAHLARLQELTAPSPEAKADFEAALKNSVDSVLSAEYIPDAEKADIPLVVDGVRWLVAGRPHEPLPTMCHAYTMPEGYPVLEFRHDVSAGVRHDLLAGTRDARWQISDEIAQRSDQIAGELQAIIELSPGYKKCEELILGEPHRVAAPEEWRRAEVAQRVSSRYGLTLAGLKNNPGAVREYVREMQRVDLAEGSTKATRTQGSASLDRAQSYFGSLIEEQFKKTHPGEPVPEDLLDFNPNTYTERYWLMIGAAQTINGAEACPAANSFLTAVMWRVLSGAPKLMADIIYDAKEQAAEDLARAFSQLGVHGLYGGSWPRWWLNQLDYPPQLSPIPQAKTPDLQRQGLVSREEINRLENTLIGEILIDGRPESAAVSRRLIQEEPRSYTLPPPRDGYTPSLRVQFTPDFSTRYDSQLPSIPGYTAIAEVISPDGSRTFDFMRREQRDPYSFCTDVLTPRQRELIIDFYERTGATQMVKNLRASRNLRVGDIEDLLGRSSEYIKPDEGHAIPPVSVESGYLRMQCDGAAWLERDSLEACGMPARSLRLIDGYVLPGKNEPMGAQGHKSIEYTNPQGERFILDPKIFDREARTDSTHEIEPNLLQKASAVGRAMVKQFSNATGETTFTPAISEVSNKSDPSIETPSEIPDDTPANGPDVPPPNTEIALPSATERLRANFERQLAHAFHLDSPTRPASPERVWQHVATYCRQPGDIVAMTARLVGAASDFDLTKISDTDARDQLENITLTTELVEAAASRQPGISQRTGGYDSAMHNVLLLTLRSLKSTYETALSRPE